MLVLGLLLCLSISATRQTANYLEETAECSRNSTQAQMKHLEFFVGTDTFKELVLRNHVFIDKTLLLHEVFKDHTYLTIFYLPPKFCKTTTLDMIRTFAEVQLDSNHSIVPRERTFAYNFFASGIIVNENDTVEGTLVNPPLISRHVEIIDEHLGRYPSIHLHFIHVRTMDYGFTWGSFRDFIGGEFKRNRFLTSRISANESSRFDQLCDYFNRTEWDVSSDLAVDLPDAFIFLAEMTSKYFQKKPILYIDEYDALLGRFLHGNYLNEQEEQRVLSFFQEFFQTVFRREDIWHRIFVTGTHSIHSNIIRLLPVTKSIYHAFDNDLSHFFGFTETDIHIMREHYPRLDDEKIQEMRDYYRGYRMGQNYPIYNPWCVMNFLTTRKFEHKWTEENEFKWFSYNLWGINQMRHVWLDLLSDGVEYLSRPLEKFSLDDMWTLKNVLGISLSNEFAPKHSLSLSSKEFNQALMYQVDAGYLTLANYRREDRDITFSVQAANMEIRETVFNDLRTGYKGYLQVKVELADDATAALHQYLFSRQRQQCFKNLTRSFNKLFKQTDKLFERNQSSIDQLVNPIGRHIIDYVGLRLRYQHGYKLDRNIANGFVATRLKVSSVVIFNYNRSVQNEDVLNQIDNMTHPWVESGPQAGNSSVTYLVIGVNNGTEISIRRYGAEPPIEIKTTPPPVRAVTLSKPDMGRMSEKLDKMLKDAEKEAELEDEEDDESETKKPVKTTPVTSSSSPKTKKSKSRPQQAKVTKVLNVTMANKTTVANEDRTTKGGEIQTTGQTIGQTSELTTVSKITNGSKSSTQFNFNSTNSLNKSSTSTIVIETTKALEIQATKHQTDSTKTNLKNSTHFKSTQQSPTTNIPQETKSNLPITETSEPPLTIQTTASTASMETKSTTSTTTNPVEQISSTLSTPLQTPSSKLNPTSTKSSNNSYMDEAELTKIINSVTKGIAPQTLSNDVISNEIFTGNNIFDTITFAESSLNEITRVRRFVIVEPTSSTMITTKVTELPKTTTKVNNSNKTLAPKDPAQITTITPSQETSTTVSFSEKTESTKSITTSTKESTINAVITTEKLTKSPKTETNVTDSNTTLAPKDPAQIKTITQAQESTTIKHGKTKKSKSTKSITTSTKESTANSVIITEKLTESPKTETNITDFNTTLAPKDPAQITTITQAQESTTIKHGKTKKSKSTKSITTSAKDSIVITMEKPTTLAPKDPAEITTITPAQESLTTTSISKKLKSTTSPTNSTKESTISTVTILEKTTESPKPETKIIYSKTTLVPENPAQITTITQAQESTTIKHGKTKKSKSTKSITTSTKESTANSVIITEKLTKSPKTETNITDFNTTLALKDPAQITTITQAQESTTIKHGKTKKSKSTKSITTSAKDSVVITTEKPTTLAPKDPAEITTITPAQESVTTTSISKKLKSTTSPTNSTKESTISTVTILEKTTESPKPETKIIYSETTLVPENPAQITTITSGEESSSTSSVSTPTSPLNPAEITTASVDQTTTKSKTKAPKSHSKATRPFNSTFSKKKKGKNFNATAFVRGNSTKFTKFPRGKQIANRTKFSTGSTTTQSTTTVITRDTFFPTRGWTRPPLIKRRAGSKVPQKSTTISRIKFLKLFFGVRG